MSGERESKARDFPIVAWDERIRTWGLYPDGGAPNCHAQDSGICRISPDPMGETDPCGFYPGSPEQHENKRLLAAAWNSYVRAFGAKALAAAEGDALGKMREALLAVPADTILPMWAWNLIIRLGDSSIPVPAPASSAQPVAAEALLADLSRVVENLLPMAQGHANSRAIDGHVRTVHAEIIEEARAVLAKAARKEGA